MSGTGRTYEGKVTLVTGSRRGLGRLVADHVLAHGGRVVGFARGESTIDRPEYAHLRVDVSDPAEVTRGFAGPAGLTGHVHIVVNNAAVLTSQYAMIMPPAAAAAMVDTNLLGAFIVSREAASSCAAAGGADRQHRLDGGGPRADRRLAVRRHQGRPGDHGQRRGPKELAPFNVTCNTLAVTAIRTDMLASTILPRRGRRRRRAVSRSHATPSPTTSSTWWTSSLRPQLVRHRADRLPRRRHRVIERVVDEHLRANTYVVETGAAGEVVVIDPGLDWDGVRDAVGGRRVAAIACTHGHFDHVGSSRRTNSSRPPAHRSTCTAATPRCCARRTSC